MVLKRKNQKDLLFELVRTRFKLRYNNSVLGFMWVLMKPFLEFVILFTVFTALGRGGGDPNYTPNLLLGTLTFSLFREGIAFGMNSLMDVSQIILKINVPRKLAVSSSIIMAIINFVINIFLVFVITLFLPFNFNLKGFPYFVLIIAILIMLVYSLSLFTSILLVKLRDLSNIVDLALQLLFWGSGIFYDIKTLSGLVGELIRLNPVGVSIDAARNALVSGEITWVGHIAAYFVISIILFLIGTQFFNKRVKEIAEHF